MARVTGVARQSPLGVYFTFAFAFTWALLPFARSSVTIGLVALFGPAVGALVTAALAGRDELHELRARVMHWRVATRWYVVALILPLPISAVASWLEYLWGAHGAVALQPISILGLVVFVLVVGEEIGWRGFALPRLLARFGPWAASVILGIVWAVWHLPLFFLAGMPQYGSPFPAFVGYTIGLSIILTFLARHAQHSVVIATLFHGAVNTFGVVNTAASPTLRGWGNAVAYLVVALVIASVAWSRRVTRA